MVLEAGPLREVPVVPQIDLEESPFGEADAPGERVPEEEIYPAPAYPQVEGPAVVDLPGFGVPCGAVELLLHLDAERTKALEGLQVASPLLEGRHPGGDESLG